MFHPLGKHLGKLGVAALVLAPTAVTGIVGGTAGATTPSGSPLTIVMIIFVDG